MTQRRNRLSRRYSAVLNDNSDFTEKLDDIRWYEKSILRPSVTFNFSNREETILDDNSNTEVTNLPDNWYERLSTSSNKSKLIQQKSRTVNENTLVQSSDTDRDEILVKKRPKFKSRSKKSDKIVDNNFTNKIFDDSNASSELKSVSVNSKDIKKRVSEKKNLQKNKLLNKESTPETTISSLDNVKNPTADKLKSNFFQKKKANKNTEIHENILHDTSPNDSPVEKVQSHVSLRSNVNQTDISSDTTDDITKSINVKKNKKKSIFFKKPYNTRKSNNTFNNIFNDLTTQSQLNNSNNSEKSINNRQSLRSTSASEPKSPSLNIRRAVNNQSYEEIAITEPLTTKIINKELEVCLEKLPITSKKNFSKICNSSDHGENNKSAHSIKTNSFFNSLELANLSNTMVNLSADKPSSIYEKNKESYTTGTQVLDKSNAKKPSNLKRKSSNAFKDVPDKSEHNNSKENLIAASPNSLKNVTRNSKTKKSLDVVINEAVSINKSKNLLQDSSINKSQLNTSVGQNELSSSTMEFNTHKKTNDQLSVSGISKHASSSNSRMLVSRNKHRISKNFTQEQEESTELNKNSSKNLSQSSSNSNKENDSQMTISKSLSNKSYNLNKQNSPSTEQSNSYAEDISLSSEENSKLLKDSFQKNSNVQMKRSNESFQDNQNKLSINSQKTITSYLQASKSKNITKSGNSYSNKENSDNDAIVDSDHMSTRENFNILQSTLMPHGKSLRRLSEIPFQNTVFESYESNEESENNNSKEKQSITNKSSSMQNSGHSNNKKNNQEQETHFELQLSEAASNLKNNQSHKLTQSNKIFSDMILAAKDKMEAKKEKVIELMKKETVEREKKAKQKIVQAIEMQRFLAKKKKELNNNNKQKKSDKAYIVNGKVYKQPRLPMPKQWVTKRLYKYLWDLMEPEFGHLTRIKSEKLVMRLSDFESLISKRKTYDKYKNDLEDLMKKMAEYKIVKTRFDFYNFVHDFLPYSFRIKVIPMNLPGNIPNIPYEPEKLFQPILGEN